MVAVSRDTRNVTIEVAYGASTREQVVISVDIPVGSTVEDAIRMSGVLERFPHICLRSDSVGIFGQRASLVDTVSNGDRVEIYRPLVVDPKQARRYRAGEMQKSKSRRR